MKFIVLFKDNPGLGSEIRAKYLPEHLAFLERNADQIKAAGPLLGDDAAAAGGLWLVDADAHDDVRELVEVDPFWPTGLRKSFRVLTWNQVFADGKRLVKV